ncbi:hypothetical protein NPIL_373691 [Nephila pilipes]|uniref:Uncharacterized protein n=1 Tax=Nephila pilipes TaxID=299642 RepID=A0A8X6P0B1_NEPPI|nr:hypothetical protein NPIL_373691 [Nephila pilipes]
MLTAFKSVLLTTVNDNHPKCHRPLRKKRKKNHRNKESGWGEIIPPLTVSETDTSIQNIIPHVEFLKGHLLHHGHPILKTVKKSVKAPITQRSGVNSKSLVAENWILFSSVPPRRDENKPCNLSRELLQRWQFEDRSLEVNWLHADFGLWTFLQVAARYGRLVESGSNYLI